MGFIYMTPVLIWGELSRAYDERQEDAENGRKM